MLCRFSAMECPWFALLYLSFLAISFQTLRNFILTLIWMRNSSNCACYVFHAFFIFQVLVTSGRQVFETQDGCSAATQAKEKAL